MTDNQSTVNTTPEVKADKPLTGKEKRQLNLRPTDKLTPEERKEISRKGGIARQEQVRQRKTMKEQLIAFLDGKASREVAKKYLGADAEALADEDLTYQGILGAKMWQEAVEKGNAKAAEFVRDTSGQKIKDEINLTGQFITASDRDLLANIADRYRTENDENS